ncbi:MAG: response regulator [Bacteriovoracaceae bacterium]|nr:response regulator [Bacteriovoracaceae bacterium]
MSNNIAIPQELNFLVVDDMTFYHSLLKDHLKKMGFSGRVLHSIGVKEATEMLKENFGTELEIHFIILDLHMARHKGTKLVELVRSSEKFKNLPILLYTSETERDEIVNAFEVGVTSYLFKPWELKDLKEKILFCWEKHNKEE